MHKLEIGFAGKYFGRFATVCAIGSRRFMELDDVIHIRRCISVQCVMKERERVDCALVGHTIFNRAFLLRSRITEKKLIHIINVYES